MHHGGAARSPTHDVAEGSGGKRTGCVPFYANKVPRMHDVAWMWQKQVLPSCTCTIPHYMQVVNPATKQQTTEEEADNELADIVPDLVEVQVSGDLALDAALQAAGAQCVLVSQVPSVRRKCLLTATWTCQRGSKEKPSRQPELANPIRSKKVGCPYKVVAKIYEDDPGRVFFFQEGGHLHHIPGDEEDRQWLSIEKSLEDKVAEVRSNAIVALCIGSKQLKMHS